MGDVDGRGQLDPAGEAAEAAFDAVPAVLVLLLLVLLLAVDGEDVAVDADVELAGLDAGDLGGDRQRLVVLADGHRRERRERRERRIVAEESTEQAIHLLLELAQRLGFLYLQHELAVDKVYHDAIWLQKPGVEGMTWQWLAGVNYFCANADGRWWQDHRIPGGLAFSVNSVGHLAKAGAIANAMNALDQVLGVPNESATPTKVDSLGKALEFAMRTIDKASPAVSGKAMQLIPLPQGALPSPKCPVQLPADLADKDFRCYRGYYHTDITLPSEYFLPDIQRPSHCKPQTLDFTYLFDDDLENPDYWTMGAGRRTRGDSPKRSRFEPMSLLIADCERLVQVLNGKS